MTMAVTTASSYPTLNLHNLAQGPLSMGDIGVIGMITRVYTCHRQMKASGTICRTQCTSIE